MARTNLPLTFAAVDGNVNSTPTNIDATNQMNVQPQVSGSDKYPSDRTPIIFRIVPSANGQVTVDAGAMYPAGQAFTSKALVVALTNGTPVIVGPIASSEYSQADQSINLDFTSGTAGTIEAICVAQV